MCCPAPFFFLMFWGQIGVKIMVFSKNEQFHTTQKRQQKKARSLDKVPKLRAFLFLSVILKNNCSWKRTSQMIQCTPTKQRECVLHPTPPQIFCTNSVPSFKTNTIFPSRCTTALSTAASHNCVSNSGSIPFCPFNAL